MSYVHSIVVIYEKVFSSIKYTLHSVVRRKRRDFTLVSELPEDNFCFSSPQLRNRLPYLRQDRFSQPNPYHTITRFYCLAFMPVIYPRSKAHVNIRQRPPNHSKSPLWLDNRQGGRYGFFVIWFLFSPYPINNFQ